MFYGHVYVTGTMYDKVTALMAELGDRGGRRYLIGGVLCVAKEIRCRIVAGALA